MSGDDLLGGLLLGGIIGAALNSPNQSDKQELETYRALQADINSRTQKIPLSQDLINKLGRKPEYYTAFIESYKAFSHGLFRSSVAVASALIESMLREKFEGSLGYVISEALEKQKGKESKKSNFYELIENAKKTELLEEPDYHFLHGLRSQRNNSVHDVLKEVSESDNITILNIAIKIIGKLI